MQKRGGSVGTNAVGEQKNRGVNFFEGKTKYGNREVDGRSTENETVPPV
jgi:hypothetical protein